METQIIGEAKETDEQEIQTIITEEWIGSR